jgi:hypothetical protein
MNRRRVSGFATGYDESGIQSRYSSSPILHKPFARDHLQAVIEQLRLRAPVPAIGVVI